MTRNGRNACRILFVGRCGAGSEHSETAREWRRLAARLVFKNKPNSSLAKQLSCQGCLAGRVRTWALACSILAVASFLASIACSRTPSLHEAAAGGPKNVREWEGFRAVDLLLHLSKLSLPEPAKFAHRRLLCSRRRCRLLLLLEPVHLGLRRSHRVRRHRGGSRSKPESSRLPAACRCWCPKIEARGLSIVQATAATAGRRCRRTAAEGYVHPTKIRHCHGPVCCCCSCDESGVRALRNTQ